MAWTYAAVLKALAEQCQGDLLPHREACGWHPEIMKQVAAAGHAVGSHTWSHKDLSKLSEQEGKDEIEKGIAGVVSLSATSRLVRSSAFLPCGIRPSS